jgi:hypothetical protein
MTGQAILSGCIVSRLRMGSIDNVSVTLAAEIRPALGKQGAMIAHVWVVAGHAAQGPLVPGDRRMKGPSFRHLNMLIPVTRRAQSLAAGTQPDSATEGRSVAGTAGGIFEGGMEIGGQHHSAVVGAMNRVTGSASRCFIDLPIMALAQVFDFMALGAERGSGSDQELGLRRGVSVVTGETGVACRIVRYFQFQIERLLEFVVTDQAELRLTLAERECGSRLRADLHGKANTLLTGR